MNIEFREMKPEETKTVCKVAHNSFGPIESLMVSKPKHAVLAVAEDEIVGGIAYRIVSGKGGRKLGFAETAFVSRAHAGNGIGSQLYRATTEALKNKGCETIITMVRDDNAASWKAFEKAGYHRVSLLQTEKRLGLYRFVWFWLVSLNCIAVGHDIWMNEPVQAKPVKNDIAWYALVSMVTLLPSICFNSSSFGFGMHMAGILLLLFFAAAGGFLATLLTKQKWQFRVTWGGLMLSMVISSIGGVLPIIGRFYPDKYLRTPEFKRNMAVEALGEWLGGFLLFAFSVIWRDTSFIWTVIYSYGTSILLYHSIPFFPLGSYGGARIWSFHKGLSIMVFLFSLGMVIFL